MRKVITCQASWSNASTNGKKELLQVLGKSSNLVFGFILVVIYITGSSLNLFYRVFLSCTLFFYFFCLLC